MSFLRPFWSDRRGAVAMYFGLGMPLLLGITALAFDVGRVMSLQSELQAAADAAALAGAAELDGQKNAISRAQAAAGCPGSGVNGAFGTNYQTFATPTKTALDPSGKDVDIVLCYFYSDPLTFKPNLLPIDTASNDGNTTKKDTDAVYIKVVARLRSVANAFITIVGGPQIASTTATATAGFSQTICQPAPLMICNPNEASDPTFSKPPAAGQELLLPYSGSIGFQQGASGNWGLLDPPTVTAADSCGVGNGNGDPVIEKFLAQNASFGCTSTGLTTRPGKPNKVPQSLNVRFDLQGDKIGAPSDPCYTPAPNVTKGYDISGNGAQAACNSDNPDIPPAAEGMPDDATISGLFGSGNWDLTTYWGDNHAGANNLPAPVPQGLKDFAAGKISVTLAGSGTSVTLGNPPGTATIPTPSGLTPTGVPTRYATYLYELSTSSNIPAPNAPAGHLENGAPQCYKGNNATIDRRFLYAAVVNCSQQGVTGQAKGVIPVGFIQLFMTQPASPDQQNGAMHFEVLQATQANGPNGIVHTAIQLYR